MNKKVVANVLTTILFSVAIMFDLTNNIQYTIDGLGRTLLTTIYLVQDTVYFTKRFPYFPPNFAANTFLQGKLIMVARNWLEEYFTWPRFHGQYA